MLFMRCVIKDLVIFYFKYKMEPIKTLVFGGGGVRGIAYIGVLKYIHQNNIPVNIERIVSVSAGSIFGLTYAIGYTHSEMETIMNDLDMDSLQDPKVRDFFNGYGIDTGNNVMKWLAELMERKNFSKTTTFGELFVKTGIRLTIVATNVNRYCAEGFDYINSPHMNVLKAIRMSMAIPFVFKNEKYKDNIYVDGGIVMTYPIKWLNINELQGTVGCKLSYFGENPNEVKEDIKDIRSYVYHIIACAVIQKDQSMNEKQEYAEKTITIKTTGVSSVNFKLTTEQKRDLIHLGYITAKKWFKNNFVPLRD